MNFQVTVKTVLMSSRGPKGPNGLSRTFFCFILFSFLLGCQQKPTVLSDTGEILLKDRSQAKSLFKDFAENKKILLVDARDSFEFEKFHLPGSLSFHLDEILERNDRGQRRVTKDLFKVARRLANYGVTPESQIIMLGEAQKGRGEEAAMAFVFKNLGIEKILVTRLEHFRANPLQSSERLSQPMWKPAKEKLTVTGAELKNLLKNDDSRGATGKARSSALQVNLPTRILHGVFLGDQLKTPDWAQKSSAWKWSAQVLNPTEFFDESGTMTQEAISLKLNLKDADLVVIHSQDLMKAFARGYVSLLSGARKIVVLEE